MSGGRKSNVNWTGCPAITDDDESENENDVSQHVEAKTDVDSHNTFNNRVPLDPYSVAKSLLEDANKAEQIVLDDGDGDSESSDDALIPSLARTPTAVLHHQLQEQLFNQLESHMAKVKKRLTETSYFILAVGS